MNNNVFRFILIWLFLLILVSACLDTSEPVENIKPFPAVGPTQTATQRIVQPTPTERTTPTATSIPEPQGCQLPPDDYTRVKINGWTINQRTMAMLAHAQELYGGEIELTGYAITQGSYHDNGSASFGTHLGGGAVDISVMQRGTYTILWDDLPTLILALRTAGFAAWFRDYGELSPNSPYHIHAIAIGDKELSSAAQEQLTGEAGYFRGYSGLPIETYGAPSADRYGGPIICAWMLELGYQDLR